MAALFSSTILYRLSYESYDGYSTSYLRYEMTGAKSVYAYVVDSLQARKSTTSPSLTSNLTSSKSKPLFPSVDSCSLPSTVLPFRFILVFTLDTPPAQTGLPENTFIFPSFLIIISPDLGAVNRKAVARGPKSVFLSYLLFINNLPSWKIV